MAKRRLDRISLQRSAKSPRSFKQPPGERFHAHRGQLPAPRYEQDAPNPGRAADFIVEAVADGTVNLKWNRNGGPANTNYVIETQTPGDETWIATYQTTKTRATLAGFPPGQPANFSIVAKKRSQFAYPTTTETIYAPAPSALSFSEAA